MAFLKITTPDESKGALAVSGATARCWLNNIEISQFVSGIRVDIPVDGPLRATLDIFVSKLELGIQANLILAVPELQSIVAAE